MKFDEFWPEYSKISNIFALNGFLLNNVYNVWAKKCKGVIFHEPKEWCKIWRKTYLWFKKGNEELGKFLPEHSRVSKLGLWWSSFVQSRKFMSLKFTEEICVIAIKNDAKSEEELACHSKLTWKIWRVLTRQLENLKKLLFIWVLCPKYIMLELKKVQGSYVW